MPFYRCIAQIGTLLLLLTYTVACTNTLPTSQHSVADSTASPIPPTPTPLVYREPFNEKVDVGGHKLSIKCIGSGSPTVVLDAGLNGTGDTWIKVWPHLKSTTRACIYDRAGLGESEPGPVPRTSQTIATELHTLLINAGIEGPYVLVGHSFGGYNVRLFASQYPEQVAGMVLVDTTPEDGFDRVAALLPPPKPGECQRLTESRNEAFDNREGVDFPTSTQQVRQASHSLGDRPLIVLSHGRPSQTPAGCDTPASLNEQIDQVQQELQAQLARLSSNSLHIIAEKSGHHIQMDQPELVIEAIRQVVQAAQTGASLTAP